MFYNKLENEEKNNSEIFIATKYLTFHAIQHNQCFLFKETLMQF